MLQKLRDEELQAEKPLAELDSLGHTDWVSYGSSPALGQRAQPLRCPGSVPGSVGALLGLRAIFMFSGAQARLWVQLMRELRHGVKLKKVQEQEFNPLPTEFQLTPFEMLMQDIRARNYKLRKVMVSCWGRGACPRAFRPTVALDPLLCVLGIQMHTGRRAPDAPGSHLTRCDRDRDTV